MCQRRKKQYAYTSYSSTARLSSPTVCTLYMLVDLCWQVMQHFFIVFTIWFSIVNITAATKMNIAPKTSIAAGTVFVIAIWLRDLTSLDYLTPINYEDRYLPFISYFSGYRWFNLACNIYRNAKWILFCHSKEENNRHIQRSRCFGRRAKFTRDDNLINYPSDWNKKHQLLILFIQTSLPSNPF